MSVKTPRIVRVGPHKYDIVFDKEACVAANVVGVCLNDDARIILDPGLADTMKRETLLHELLHAVWYQTPLDRRYDDDAPDSVGEEIVYTLASRLLSLLRDNPKLVEYLTQEA